MLGVCTKPAASEANEALVASSAFEACEAVPVRAPAKEPVNDPVMSEPATVEAFDKVPTEILGVCTKPAELEANEALVASSAFEAWDEVPVKAPAKEPVNDPVILEPPIVESFVRVPTKMLGVCTKPAALEANEALVVLPVKEPVNEPVILELATVEAFVKSPV